MILKDVNVETFSSLRGMEAVKARVKFADLASALGISEQAVKMWKKVPKNRAQQVADLLEVPVEQISPPSDDEVAVTEFLVSVKVDLESAILPGLPPPNYRGEVLIKHSVHGWMVGRCHSGTWSAMGQDGRNEYGVGVIFAKDQIENAIGWVAIDQPEPQKED